MLQTKFHTSFWRSRDLDFFESAHVKRRLLFILGKPSEPEGPLKVFDVYKNRCHLTWARPVDDGGLEVECYAVEMQDVSTGRWTEAGRVQGDTQCGIPDLQLGHKYNFRVCSINAAGQSEPLTTDTEILARDPWGLSSFLCRPTRRALDVIFLCKTTSRCSVV